VSGASEIDRGALPERVVFSAAGRPIAGMLHRPQGAPRGVGIVLCNPFGYEAVCSNRAYRHLARRLANEGFAVLRFDYDGTGDSIGGSHEPDRVEAWQASLSAAIDFLRAESGARAIGLFGTRLGALLAATVGSARGDIASLALWAPVASGRAFHREARAFHLMRESQQSKEPAHVDPGDRAGWSARPGSGGTLDEPEDEAAGFLLSKSTVAELGKLDFKHLTRAPAPAALVIPRDDLPGGEEKLAERLTALGAAAEVVRTPGYDTLLLHPHESVVPQELLDAVARFFTQTHPPQPFDAPRPQPRVPMAGDGFVEEGGFDESGLFSITTLPASAPSHPAPLAVLCVSIGALHHIGSNRMYVELARQWAREGIATLRLDLSGLGESPPAPGEPENRLYRAETSREVSRSLDRLATQSGARRFALIGLCSGAYVAYHATPGDPRVAAQVLINPQVYQAKPEDGLLLSQRPQFRSTRFYRQALLQPDTWRRLARGEIQVVPILRTLLARNAAALEKRAAWLVGLGATEVEETLRKVSERGAHTYFIFSGLDGGLDVLEQHLGRHAARLADRENVRHEVIEGPDRTFTPLWSQRELARRLTEFLLGLKES